MLKKIFLSITFLLFIVQPLAFAANDAASTQAVQIISQDYELSESTIERYLGEGWSIIDLTQAAFLSLASGKPFEDIVKAKHDAVNWKDTENVVGVTSWHFNAGAKKLAINKISNAFGFSQGMVASLLNQRYEPTEIVIAAKLAQETGLSADTILRKKTRDITWYKVATDIGLSQSDYAKCLGELKEAFASRQQFYEKYDYKHNFSTQYDLNLDTLS